MSKIKEIQISDFRIYEGTQKFSFEGKSGVSNLVALYAPNGFGKTSFFDAVEWSFSNEIKRFEQKLINEAIKDEDEDSILLTNSYSYSKGRQGRVKIITDKDSFIEKSVDARKKRNSEFYSDYRMGKISNGSISSNLSNLPETNILTQDQIDAFLRFKSPEDKFEALKEFWPQGESAAERLKELREFKKVVSNKLDEIKINIGESKKRLDTLAKDDTNIKKINSWLTKLTEQKNINCTITVERISDDVSKEIYDTIYIEKQANNKAILLEIEKLKEKQAELAILFFGLKNYNSDLEQIAINGNLLHQFQKRQTVFISINEKEDLIRKSSKILNELNIKIADYQTILLNFDNYISDSCLIFDYKSMF